MTPIRDNTTRTTTPDPENSDTSPHTPAVTMPDHRANIVGRKRRDQVKYACEQLGPTVKPKPLIQWLNEHGAEISKSGEANARNLISRYRRERGRDTNGNLTALTPDAIADLDSTNEPEPTSEEGSETPTQKFAREARERLSRIAAPITNRAANADEDTNSSLANTSELASNTVTNTFEPANSSLTNANKDTNSSLASKDELASNATTNIHELANDQVPSTNKPASNDKNEPSTAEKDKAAGKVVAGAPRIITVLYFCVASIALYGQSDGMMRWLSVRSLPMPKIMPLPDSVVYRLVAIGPGLVVELFAVALMAYADNRAVYHYERAWPARILAYGFASGVVLLNWEAHRGDVAMQAFFAGVSLGGFAVYLIHSAARRRDAFRALGRTTTPAPIYPLYQWVTHPVITWEARCVAVARNLGTWESLDVVSQRRKQAATNRNEERNRAELSELIRQHLAAKYEGDPQAELKAEIEAKSFDPDVVAGKLRARANNDTLADQISAGLSTITPAANSSRSGRKATANSK